MKEDGRWRAPFTFVVLATLLRVYWVWKVPTIPVGDFAMYRESANYLVEFGRLDPGFIYMPGFVVALAALRSLGTELAGAKLFGALCGGLIAWPVWSLSTRLFDGPSQQRRPVGNVAAALYTLWPGGISLASVVATDLPAAGLTLSALALLAWAASQRGRRALVLHACAGAVFALASYVRAVALPLLAAAALFLWVAGHRGRDFVRRAAITAVTAGALLLPWGVYNARQEGAFTLADSHGGITALMGGNPNAEGTYSRALHEMWKEVMGRSFLSPPHQETDHLAWSVAKRWWRASPAWTLGMIPLRAERLFGWEHGLLYWSMYRPGVLPERDVLAAEAWRAPLTVATDGYWLLLTVAFVLGCRSVLVPARGALALAPLARAGLVLLMAAALTSTATYLLLVAEPRYRLGIEALMIPVAAAGLVSTASSLMRWLKARPRPGEEARPRPGEEARPRLGEEARPPEPSRPLLRRWVLGAIPSVALLGSVALLVLLVPTCGQRLRERGRWAVTVAHVDGRACFFYVVPTNSPSMVRGMADELELRAGPGHAGRARAELHCPQLPRMPSAPRRLDPTTLSFEVDARGPGFEALLLQGHEPRTATLSELSQLSYALPPEEAEGPWSLTFAPQTDVILHLRHVTLRSQKSQAPVQAPKAASNETATPL